MEGRPIPLARRWRWLWSLGLTVLALVLVVTSFPGRMRAISGYPARLPLLGPVRISAPEGFVSLMGRDDRGVVVRFSRPGSVRLDLSLWGLVPLPPLVVEVVPPLELMPGGQSIGVLLSPRGVLVDRTTVVRDARGRPHEPARKAGIEPGDLIVAADGATVSSVADLTAALRRAGEEGRGARLRVVRDGTEFATTVFPVAVPDRGGSAADAVVEGVAGAVRWVAGLMVREPAAGVGTLTFFDRPSGYFGALGHMIVESSRQGIPLKGGRVVRAAITGVSAGTRGKPGEKIGSFQGAGATLGLIEQDTPVGIFGRLVAEPPPGQYREPLPVALGAQVREGPAMALTVLRGEKVEAFQIEIVRIRALGVPPSQRLVLRVVDPRLLREAGGIVQGMSGSPIVQDGRLAGAVTHVAIQDPSRGFGVLMEDMVEAAGLWQIPAGQAGVTPNVAVAA